MAYLKNVLVQAKAVSCGVAWRAGGGNSLGVRSSQAPTERAVSVWRAKAVPFSWTESDLFGVLQEAGWTDLSVVAYPTKKVRPWLLKAKAPANVDGVFAAVEAGSVLVVMERAVARGPINRESRKLIVRPWVGVNTSVILPSPVFEVEDDNVAATAMETQEDEKEDGATNETGVKRPGSTPGSAEHVRKTLRVGAVQPRKLVFPGFTVRDCGADGSCGYNCIAIGAALVRGSKWEELHEKRAALGATLRVQVAQHIGKHVSTYKPLWTPDISTTTVEKEDGEIPKSWECWLMAIRRHKRWICGLTIKAAATTRLGIRIIVVLKQADGSWAIPMTFGTSKKKEDPIVIGLDEGAGHYVLLVPDHVDMIPKSWMTAGVCEVTMTSQVVLRGAGNSEEDFPDKSWLPPGTPVSKRSGHSAWLPPSTPVSSENGIAASHDWLPPVTPSRAETGTHVKTSVFAAPSGAMSEPEQAVAGGHLADVSNLSDVACVSWACPLCFKEVSASTASSLKRKRLVHLALHYHKKVEPAASSNAPAVRGPEPLVWTCHLCGERLEAATGGALTSKRASHLASRHPGKTRGHWHRNTVDVVSTSAELPKEQQAWVCIWCKEALPDLPRWQLEKSIAKHLRSRHGRRQTSAAASNKARGKLYHQDKAALPAMKEGKLRLGRKLRQRGRDRRDSTTQGHDLHEVVDVDWKTWNGISVKKRLGAGGDTLLTCTKCLLVTRAQNKFNPCRGNHKVTTAQMSLWRRLSQTNRLALVKVWGLSLEAACQLFESAAAGWRSAPQQLGHDIVEICGKRKHVTCRNCWFIRQCPGKLTQCPGRPGAPTKRQMDAWKDLKRLSGVGVQANFANEWGVTLKEAAAFFGQKAARGMKRPASKHAVEDSWQHDVCEDGDVRPHPGPTCMGSWNLVSLNTGGLPGVWRAVEEFLWPRVVACLALQEIAASPNQLIALQRIGLKFGYKFFFQSGKPSVGGCGEAWRAGGVGLFVKATFPQRPAFALVGEFSQCLGVWIDGWLLTCAYYA